MLGLTLALRLRQQGHDVTVLEAAPRLGGLADAWQIGDVTWDRHYHVILLSDLRLRGLLDELGLGDQVDWAVTRTGFYTGGTLYSMSNTLEFLGFPPLDAASKLRLGATIFYASRLRNWRRLETIGVEDWLRRWSGDKTFDTIWRPLLRAKLGDSYADASAAFIWSIIARMYAARRSGLKKEMFGTVRGGYATVLERFGQVLDSAGVAVRTGVRVRRVGPVDGGGVAVDLGDDATERFDRVAVTLAAPLAARLCPDLAPAERAQLESIRYQGIVCASVLLRRPLAGYYVTNITDEWVPYTAVIEMTALVDPARFGGRGLVYLPKYVPPDDPLFDADDDAIRARFLSALARMVPDLSLDRDVLAFRVSRVRNVFPVATLRYSERVPSMWTSVPGLHLVGSAQIVNGTLNVDESVRLAERAARTLLGAPP